MSLPGRLSDKPVYPWSKLDFSKRSKHRALRVAVYERDDYTCQHCGFRIPDERIPPAYDGRYALGAPVVGKQWLVYLHIDHIVPRFRGGAVDHIDNLQALCESCNIRKGHR